MPKQPKADRNQKIQNFFQFLAGRGFIAGEDYGLVSEGKFFLSDRAKELVESPIGEEWLEPRDRFSILILDIHNSPEPAKSILLATQEILVKFSAERNFSVDLLMDILSGVVANEQEDWNFDETQKWSGKVVRFHRIKAIDFIALFCFIQKTYQEQCDIYCL